MKKKTQPVIVHGISKDIQFKGMKHVYVGDDTKDIYDKDGRYLRTIILNRKYNLINKATGKVVNEFVKS